MKTWNHLLLTLALVLGMASSALAQTFASTTLATALSTTTGTTVVVSSATGIIQGYWVYVDREAMLVTNVSGTTLTVQRGTAGFISTHFVGAPIYSGPPSWFARQPPTSTSCPSGPNIYIDVDGGGMWTCQGGIYRNLSLLGPAPAGAFAVSNGPFSPTVWANSPFGGGFDIPSASCYAFNSDTWIQRTSAGAIAVSSSSCGGAINGTVGAGTFTLGAASDVVLVRDGANAFAQRNGTNAQTFSVYNTFTSATSYERAMAGWSANAFYLSTQKGGAGGTSRDMYLGPDGSALLGFRTNSVLRWYVDTTGHFLPNADNTYDIGSVGLRVRTVYAGASVLSGKVTTYNGLTTAGNGVPSVVASGRVTAQTAAAAAITSFTPSADGTFEVSGNILVTAATTATFSMTVTYTDEGNTSRTVTMPFSVLAGTVTSSVTNVAGNVPYMGLSVKIRAKSGTAITVQTTGTFTSVTYNAEATIIQIV